MQFGWQRDRPSQVTPMEQMPVRSKAWSVHPGLAGNSRLRAVVAPGERSDMAALAVLVVAGVAAAMATVCFDLRLRIPGHAILRAVFPMTLGLALAPRRLGGTIMGMSALGSALALTTGGSFAIGFGALTSLALTGPFLDIALWRARTGWRLYLAFALAGLACNLAALTIRAGAKFGGFDHALARPLAAWWFPALGTYALCGLVAGLVSAAAWFRFSSDRRQISSEPAA